MVIQECNMEKLEGLLCCDMYSRCIFHWLELRIKCMCHSWRWGVPPMGFLLLLKAGVACKRSFQQTRHFLTYSSALRICYFRCLHFVRCPWWLSVRKSWSCWRMTEVPVCDSLRCFFFCYSCLNSGSSCPFRGCIFIRRWGGRCVWLSGQSASFVVRDCKH